MQRIIYPFFRFGFSFMLLFFGLNQFFHYLPEHQYHAEAQGFITALHQSKYVFYTVGFTQISLALALLFNRYIPLALILFTPILVNVVFFHLFMDIEGIVKVIPTVICFAYFVYRYKDFFIQIIKTSKNGSI